MSTGTAAMQAAEAGLRVFPLVPRGKKPLWQGFQRTATDDAGVIAAIWRDVPDANVGVLCGNGLVVVDTDSAEADALVRELGMPDTPTVRTADGRHYYLAGESRNRNGLLPDVDIRGSGGYVVGAGSMHPSGVAYAWEIAPWEVDLASLPPALSEMLSKRRKPGGGKLPPTIEPGERNARLFGLACSLRGRDGLGYEELRATLVIVNAQRCAPPLDIAEVERIARSASSYDAPPLWATKPFACARDPRLRLRARHLLAALATYANDEGKCWPGIRRLSEDTGMAKNTVERARDELVTAGRIVVERRRRRSNLYRLVSLQEALLEPQSAAESGSSVLTGRTPGGAG
jgi:hypothetical protein